MPSRKIRQDRPLAEQHEEWTAHLRRQAVSRRTVVRGAVGAAAGSLLLGSGRWADAAVAATLAGTGTIAGGFVVNGRHLSFGEDPATEMRVGGQLLNVSQYNAVPPRSVRVFLDYGRDRSYGAMAEAEIRELITHVPVWDGKPGGAAGLPDAERGSVLRACAADWPEPGHPVPLPVPLHPRG